MQFGWFFFLFCGILKSHTIHEHKYLFVAPLSRLNLFLLCGPRAWKQSLMLCAGSALQHQSVVRCAGCRVLLSGHFMWILLDSSVNHIIYPNSHVFLLFIFRCAFNDNSQPLIIKRKKEKQFCKYNHRNSRPNQQKQKKTDKMVYHESSKRKNGDVPIYSSIHAQSGLLRRRYSLPEIIIRKWVLLVWDLFIFNREIIWKCCDMAIG